MPKTFTDLDRHALNGQTMGTRWSALFHDAPGLDLAAVKAGLQAVVDLVDGQMSTWKPESDLNRLNNARPSEWVNLPEALMTVLEAGLAIGAASDGAFDITMGDAVEAWGFSGLVANETAIRNARNRGRTSAADTLELDRANGRARKHADLRVDLNGIAKGYGVDRLAEAARAHGIDNCLVAIDGELRALGHRPDGSGWPIAIEKPDHDRRAAHSLIELEEASIATSGDYRHWVEVSGRRLSHTMDPKRGMPLVNAPASATVIARDCMTADAWATAMMVLGVERGLPMAEKFGLSVLFLRHGSDDAIGSGLFSTSPKSNLDV